MVGFGRAARLAGLTLGPHGGRVVLERADDFPELTRDGFTAIRDLEDDDRFATLGTELLKACVKKTRDTVGDGSTTTALLAGAFAEAGLRLVAAGIDPPSARRGFDGLTRDALEALKQQSGPVGGRTMLAQLALVAADGDDEIAGLVAEAVAKARARGRRQRLLSSERRYDDRLHERHGLRPRPAVPQFPAQGRRDGGRARPAPPAHVPGRAHRGGSARAGSGGGTPERPQPAGAGPGRLRPGARGLARQPPRGNGPLRGGEGAGLRHLSPCRDRRRRGAHGWVSGRRRDRPDGGDSRARHPRHRQAGDR